MQANSKVLQDHTQEYRNQGFPYNYHSWRYGNIQIEGRGEGKRSMFKMHQYEFSLISSARPKIWFWSKIRVWVKKLQNIRPKPKQSVFLNLILPASTFLLLICTVMDKWSKLQQQVWSKARFCYLVLFLINRLSKNITMRKWGLLRTCDALNCWLRINGDNGLGFGSTKFQL